MAVSSFLWHRARDIAYFLSEEQVAVRDYSSGVAATITAALPVRVFQRVGQEMMIRANQFARANASQAT